MRRHVDERGVFFGAMPVLFGAAFVLSGCPQVEEPENEGANQGANQEVNGQNHGEEENEEANQRPDPDLRCPVEVVFREAQDVETVTVSGEFNGWDVEATPMRREDGVWRAEIDVAPGSYGFKYVIDGSYEGDPPPFVYTKWVGENLNRSLNVEDCSRPGLEVQTFEVSAAGLVTAVVKYVAGIEGAGFDASTLEVTLGGVAVVPEVVGDEIRVSHQLSEYGKHSLRVRVRDEEGRLARQNPLWVPLWWEEESFEWFDAVMYLIFTDRFRQEGSQPSGPISGVEEIANYQGGNFAGIQAAIEEEYFEELGVNLLWLNPVNENTDQAWPGSFDTNMYTGYHGYWTVNPLEAEERFGGDAALKEMIEAAHARGIRVMFDLVLNHVHEDHLYCQENPSWCATTCTCGDMGCGWEELPLTCQFAPYLPDLNYRNHAIVERVVADTMRFLEKFDVDAIRIDAAKHMDHVIMRTLRLKLLELEEVGAAPFYVVGETFTGEDGRGVIMDYVAEWELQGQFDFPLMYPIRRVFGGSGSFGELEAALVASKEAYGESYRWHSPFVGNHDILRFTTYAAGNGEGGFGNTPDLIANGPEDAVDQQWLIDRVLLAHAFLLTIPGIPLMYYGDEIGLAGDGDPDNRRMMQWEWNANQEAILEGMRVLGQIRGEIEALRTGNREERWIGDDYYAFVREADGEGEAKSRVLVVFHKGEGLRSERIELPAAWPDDASLVDRVSGVTLNAVDGAVSVELGSWKYGIFEVVD